MFVHTVFCNTCLCDCHPELENLEWFECLRLTNSQKLMEILLTLQPKKTDTSANKFRCSKRWNTYWGIHVNPFASCPSNAIPHANTHSKEGTMANHQHNERTAHNETNVSSLCHTFFDPTKHIRYALLCGIVLPRHFRQIPCGASVHIHFLCLLQKGVCESKRQRWKVNGKTNLADLFSTQNNNLNQHPLGSIHPPGTF